MRAISFSEPSISMNRPNGSSSAPLLVNQCRPESERLKNCVHFVRVGHFGFLFALMLDWRVGRNALLEGQEGASADAPQTQRTAPKIESPASVESVLFMLNFVFEGANFTQATFDCQSLFLIQLVFFLNFNRHQLHILWSLVSADSKSAIRNLHACRTQRQT